ncbi:uncharacterized protein LOC142556414 [Primulina tabacum]|uniref:uncharacterized protein LOC142556414 n=1 Tax=Primulina tabacum TaxID=48773 RepID=UPI003F5A7ED5
MGFRTLEAFNRALIAKQVWRIAINPVSLVARVFKARYFKHHDIMDAPIGNNISFIWRSLLWSRKLLRKVLCWRVGNGEKIATFRDQWIPGLQSLMLPAGNPNDLDNVNSFIVNGAWNESLIRTTLPSYIAEDVLAIPLANNSSQRHGFLEYIHPNESSVKKGRFGDFKEARESLITAPAPKPLPQLERWTRPPVNTLKLEVDAAVNFDTGGYSIWVIVRDHDGQILLAFGKGISKTQSVVFAELLSIRDGMRLLEERGIEAHVITTDSLLAVQAVINPAEDLSYCGALALDIRNSLDSRTDTNLRQVGRSANRVAHSLAFFSLSSLTPFV